MSEIKKEIKLEDAMRRLDEIVKALESEGLDLDKSLKLYEEGIGLVRICNEQLADAERKIKILRVNSDGEISEEDFITREV